MKRLGGRFQSIVMAALSVTVFLVAFPGDAVWSQPRRQIKMIVPFPPGGGVDVLARIVGEEISRVHGQTIVIDNRPGAGTVIGTEAAARSMPDGNTLLMTAPAFLVNPHLRKLNYDPVTGFEPVCRLVTLPMVLVVNGSSSYRTLSDFVDAARKKPGALTLATLPGSLFHIAFEMLKRATHADIALVPYTGAAPAVTALLGGHVTSAFVNYLEIAEQLKTHKLRALATTSPSRIELLPEVPTVAESGYGDIEAEGWTGVFAPAKTPKDIIAQLSSWFDASLRTPEIRQRLVDQGEFPAGICGVDFAAFLRKQYDDYGQVIRNANIKAE